MSYSKIITRENGQHARILITNYAMPGAKPDVGVDVFTLKADGKNWDLCTQSADERKASMAMSVEDYVKHGRHPMFYTVTPAELFKAGAEAKRFGYQNPYVDGTLHFTAADGREMTAPVSVYTGNGMIDLEKWHDDMAIHHGKGAEAKIQYLEYGKRQLEVESNAHQQARVIDLPALQQLATRVLLDHHRDVDEPGFSPS